MVYAITIVSMLINYGPYVDLSIAQQNIFIELKIVIFVVNKNISRKKQTTDLLLHNPYFQYRLPVHILHNNVYSVNFINFSITEPLQQIL